MANWFGRQTDEIVCEELVYIYIHRAVEYHVLRQAEMRTVVDLAVYLAQEREVGDLFQYELVVPVAAKCKGELNR